MAASPTVVAQRMCDLLQSFPAAADTGVQWQTLLRKYDERHNTKLNIASMGFSSPLAAATSLLWDVLRLVNSEDTDNPVLAVEDDVVLTPMPGSLASWPSLYKAFFDVVSRHGTIEAMEGTSTAREPSRVLLLSQLKPMLQSHWHPNFSESGLSYLSEEGSSVQLKKMKHLVQAVLRWRNQWRERVGERQGRTNLNSALEPQLELVPSKRHNDLVLRYMPPENMLSVGQIAASQACLKLQSDLAQLDTRKRLTSEAESCETGELSPVSSSTAASTDLERELANLRAENAALRNRNERLQQHQPLEFPSLQVCDSFLHTPVKQHPVLQSDVFDDPFEPPPEARSFWGSAGSSTVDPSDFGFSSGSGTPRSIATSGACTPALGVSPSAFQAAGFSAPGQMCALVPMWFERTQIPCGIVQQARALFERADEGLPSFFVR